MPTVKDKQVTQHHDKRRDERYISRAPVIFSKVNDSLHREYASMTFNHSRNGLCLDALEALRPGTPLHIRRGKGSPYSGYDGSWTHLPASSLGEVRWCRELKDKFGTYYCIGIRYF